MLLKTQEFKITQLLINIDLCQKVIYQKIKITLIYLKKKEKRKYQLYIRTMMSYSLSNRDFKFIKISKQIL